MLVKELLDNQNVYIDSHQQGDRQTIKKEFLHLHKKMNGRKFKGWDIEIYLESNEIRVLYKKGFNNDSKETKKVKNEIQKIFKNTDDSKVKKLIKDLYEAIDSYYKDSELNDKDKEEKLVMWARRIASGFGLKPIVIQRFIDKVSGEITFTTSHRDMNGKIYYIRQNVNKSKPSIVASDDLDELF